MAKLKIIERFGITPNDLLNNENISFKAKGLFAFIQSKPDNWEFSAERIALQTKDGIDGVRTALQELEQHGYLVRSKYQDNKGYWHIEYTLLQKPTLENPTQEKPRLENTLNNSKKDYSKKDLVKKKYIYLGTFKNVKLTEKEVDTLNDDLGEHNVESLIESLSYYIETNKRGKYYTNHNLVLRKWAKDNAITKQAQEPIIIE